MSKKHLLIIVMSTLTAYLVAACAPAKPASKMAPMEMMPAAVQAAPASVRTAYQFAVANPGDLENVPCYCGCGAIGHKSNLACYLKETGAGGKPVFDDHALGCSLCVDIALDVKKLKEEGKQPGDIRAEIVSAYSAFGPGNQ